jgi:hypothetical protein
MRESAFASAPPRPITGRLLMLILAQRTPVRIRSPVHLTSRVLVHGSESKSEAAGFDSLAVCFARVRAGRRVATEPLGDAQP